MAGLLFQVFPACLIFRAADVLNELISSTIYLRRVADKSLARPGRKQATATKLRIYSTYSPRSSIHLLARCSNFSNHSRKLRKLPVQPGLRGSNDIRVGRKMANFQLFFQSMEQVVVRRDQIRRMGWMIKTLETQVGQLIMCCKCRVSKNKTPLVNFPPRLSFKMSFSCTSRDE